MISIRHVLAEARIAAREAYKMGHRVRINVAPDVYDMLNKKYIRFAGGYNTEIISEGWELWGCRYIYRQNSRLISGYFLEIV